jgi:lysylphosphatidylglycerol synthetase-like protein (DUF2156 family)
VHPLRAVGSYVGLRGPFSSFVLILASFFILVLHGLVILISLTGLKKRFYKLGLVKHILV